MKLPYPFIYNGETVTDFEPRVLTAKDLADTRKSSGSGPYSAMKAMGRASILSLNGSEDRKNIDNAILSMPFFSLYTAIIHSGAKTKGLDYVEGHYTCPNCKTVRVYGKGDDGDADTLEELDKGSTDTTELEYSFLTPVEIKNAKTGEVLESISNIVMRYPTIGDYCKGESRYPDNELLLMYYAYGQALTVVNEQAVDAAYRQKFGEVIFQKMTLVDINTLSARLHEHATGVGLERVCLKCHHRWKTDIDMSSFFDYGQ